ncbi:acyltransferase family protein [candidate division KSB1 bacterium]|nr:acyltransferase family protein [candidate division KSB1 bacterium]
MTTDKKSLQWIFIAKGLALILVVIGHFYPAHVPTYWEEMRKIIYLFHMPVFFMLSGYLYKHAKYSYGTLLKKKVKRLLYPFLSLTLIFFVLKLIASLFFELEYPVNLRSLSVLLLDPVFSYMPLLWFIHALIIYFITYPVMRKILKNNVLIIFLFFLGSLYLSETYEGLNKIVFNFPFFVFGILLNENGRIYRTVITGKLTQILGCAMLFIITYIIYGYTNIIRPVNIAYIPWLLLGLLGSLFIINLSQWIASLKSDYGKNWLIIIGVYSMSIFLFHSFFESAVRIVFLQIFTFITVPFEIIALTAIMAGMIFPLLVEKYILLKNKITKKYILGLS